MHAAYSWDGSVGTASTDSQAGVDDSLRTALWKRINALLCTKKKFGRSSFIKSFLVESLELLGNA